MLKAITTKAQVLASRGFGTFTTTYFLKNTPQYFQQQSKRDLFSSGGKDTKIYVYKATEIEKNLHGITTESDTCEDRKELEIIKKIVGPNSTLSSEVMNKTFRISALGLVESSDEQEKETYAKLLNLREEEKNNPEIIAKELIKSFNEESVEMLKISELMGKGLKYRTATLECRLASNEELSGNSLYRNDFNEPSKTKKTKVQEILDGSDEKSPYKGR